MDWIRFAAAERFVTWHLWVPIIVVMGIAALTLWRWMQLRRSVIMTPGATVSLRDWLRRCGLATALFVVGSLAVIVLVPLQPQVAWDVPRVDPAQMGIVVVADVSPSMQAEEDVFGREPRISGARGRMWGVKQEIRTFARSAPPGVRMALVVFAEQAYLLYPLEADRSGFLYELERSYRPNVFATGGTNTSNALEEAFAVLEEQRETVPVRAVVLLSDGERTEVDEEQLAVVLDRYRTAQIPVFSVAVGRDRAAVPDPDDPTSMLTDENGVSLTTEPDPELMAMIASETGGRAVAYREVGTLSRALRTMLQDVASLQRVQGWVDLWPFCMLLSVLTIVPFAFRSIWRLFSNRAA